MSKKRFGVLILCAVILGGAIGIGVGQLTKHSSSSTLCYQFNRKAETGLFETFQGKVCSTAPGVKVIANNYKQCVKAEGVPQCGYALMNYFASSGAYPDDAAKATLLVVQAAGGQ